MPVGDASSKERGSGARYNDGKLELTLLPPDYWYEMAQQKADDIDASLNEVGWLCDFWYGDDDAIDHAFDDITPEELVEACRVLEYGAKKYAAWNWAKGMPWSVAMACYLRHTLTYPGGSIDEESGHSHRGHAVCNLIMLRHFRDHCEDLDDRPRELWASWHDEQRKQPARESAEQLGADTPLVDEYVELTFPFEVQPHTPTKFRIGEPPLVGDPTVPWDESSEVWVHYRTVDGREGIAKPADVPTPLLNELGEIVAEEQEVRERCLRTSGILR